MVVELVDAALDRVAVAVEDRTERRAGTARAAPATPTAAIKSERASWSVRPVLGPR